MYFIVYSFLMYLKDKKIKKKWMLVVMYEERDTFLKIKKNYILIKCSIK